MHTYRLVLYSKACIGVLRRGRARALIGRLLRRMRLRLLVRCRLWLCRGRIRGPAARTVAVLLIAAGRGTEDWYAALTLLSKALLGVQPLQPPLRPAIQRGIASLTGVGRRLASGMLPVAHEVFVVELELVLLVRRGQL